MQENRKTPLYEQHTKLRAKMVPFGGWEMPIQYEGIIAETEHCRRSASLFDTCHMGEIRFEGDISVTGIENAVSFSIADVPVGRCRYGFLMNEKGGVVDDLIVYRLSEEELMIVVNAATSENDFKYIASMLHGNFRFEDISENTAKLDVQGPAAKDVMKKFFQADFDSMPYFGFEETSYDGARLMISRTGYTGELGYEIYADAGIAEELWGLLLSDERVKPAGLGARDILRLEVGLSLYGQELSEDITPVEAGLSYFVDFDKHFAGAEVLRDQKKNGAPRMKIAFEADSRRTPRYGSGIYADGSLIGEVTSGVFSPMLKKGIGLGLVKSGSVDKGSQVKIINGRTEIEGTVCGLPFYKDGTARKK